MAFSNDLLREGEDIWAAQTEHPFVVELAAGTLDEAAFLTWVRQDYRYLLDYARTFAIAGTTARDEETMTHLMGVAHEILDFEMDLHRELAADYGLSPEDLESVRKAPTCVAYTNYLVRTAYEGSLAEISAAIYPAARATSTSPSTWPTWRPGSTATPPSSRTTPVTSSATPSRGCGRSWTAARTGNPASARPCARRSGRVPGWSTPAGRCVTPRRSGPSERGRATGADYSASTTFR